MAYIVMVDIDMADIVDIVMAGVVMADVCQCGAPPHRILDI